MSVCDDWNEAWHALTSRALRLIGDMFQSPGDGGAICRAWVGYEAREKMAEDS